jgi:tripartite-type tricarboxylate transporter receptor subunit TctC
MKKLLTTLLFTISVMAQGQVCLDRPVRMIVAIAPGGGFETLARNFSERLSAQYGVPVVIENRAGAEGAVALGYAVNARPDGYTLLSMPDFVTTKPVIVGNKSVGIEDFAPVSGLVQNTELILMASLKFSPNNFKEVLEYARENPGRLTYSTNGEGSVFHVYTDAYFYRHGVDAIHVPYKGLADANLAAITGDVNLTYNGVKVATELIKSNRLKAIVAVSDYRIAGFPDVPTLKEVGASDLKFNNKLGLFAPPGTPKEVTQCVAEAILKLQQDKEFVTDKMTPFKYIPYIADPDRLAKDLAEEKTRTRRATKIQ